MRIIPRIAITTSLALAMASCANDQEAETQQLPSSTINAVLVDAPSNLDFTTTAGSAIPTLLMNNVYETLLKVDENGELVPSLAESWEVSTDGLTITFNLIENATFSNGEKFDAEIAKFNLDRANDPEVWKSFIASGLENIEEVTAVDDKTVEIHLTEPTNSLLFSLATDAGTMFHPDEVDSLATKAVGTGPYVVKEFVPGTSAKLSLREDARQEPDVTEANFSYIADSVTAINTLKSGDADLLWTVQDLEAAEGLEHDFDIRFGSTTNKVMLIFNNQSEIFQSETNRVAVASAIDAAALHDLLYSNEAYGGEKSLLNGPVSKLDPWFVEETSQKYDPESAKKMAAESNLNSFTITVPTLPYAMRSAEVIQQQLSDVGVTADIKTAEFPAIWLNDVYTNRDYEATIIAHVEPRDLSTLIDPNYYWGVQDETLIEDAKAADRSHYYGKYVEGMKDIVRRVQDQNVVAPLYELPNTVISRRTIADVQVNQPMPNLDLTTITLS